MTNIELKQVLFSYLGNTEHSSILDGSFDVVLDSGLTVFECGEFFKKDNYLLYPTLEALFNLFNDAITGSGAPCAIVIDEAWLMLQNQDFSTHLIALLKTVRKHNTLIILATQSLSDFSRAKCFYDVLASH